MVTLIKSTFKHLKNSGKYTIFNIIGLTLGLCMTIFIVMLINFEISFDNFHPNADKILLVGQLDLKDGTYQACTPYPLSQTLKDDFPEVKAVAGFNPLVREKTQIKYNNTSYSGFAGASVKVDVFEIFAFNLLLGDATNVLDAPNKMVISKSMSKKIFGNENPVGKVVEINEIPLTVTGMYDDIPDNSAFNFDMLFSEKINSVIWDKSSIAWWANGLHTFVILNDGIKISDFENHLKQIPEIYYPNFLKGRSTFFVKTFKELHFDNSILEGLVEPVSPMYLVILGAIAFLTLFIACINFINLSIAQTTKNNIEIGVRRISGAKPRQIVYRQLRFSFATTFVALFLSIPLCWQCLPLFESHVNRSVILQFTNPHIWLGVLSICIIVALVSGAIPGLLFARIQLIHAIKNKGFGLKNYGKIKGGIVVFQFGLTIALIAAQLFVFKQITDMKNADLGFDNNNLTSIPVHTIKANYQEKYNKVKLYKVELERYGSKYGFTVGSVSENVPGYYFQNSFVVHPKDAKIDECLVVSTAVDENYLDVYKILMTEGRFFSHKHKTDKQTFIINETAMKKFGWEDIDNKFLCLSHEGEPHPVVGVMKDITTTTMKKSAPPMIFRHGQHNNFPGFLTFRINPDRKAAALKFMEKTWAKMFPEVSFNYLDVKETYYKNYQSELELAQIMTFFSLFAIFLSSIGLFGMISFTSENRTKEIGIRKVNGARTIEVMAMLNKDFIKWVGTAFVLACPIAYYAMDKWLANFAYKTELSWWVFALAGLIVLVVALLTVSAQSWRAATRNPVEALRYE